jgi:flagellar basal-body rod protein FlgB
MADGVYGALTNRMNYLVARQGVIAGNIANADTPGYVAQDLVMGTSNSGFGAALAQARTNGKHMSVGGNGAGASGKPTTSGMYMQHNGNAVRLDSEMQKMNTTSLEYRMMTELYTKQIGLQRIALGRGQ